MSIRMCHVWNRLSLASSFGFANYPLHLLTEIDETLIRLYTVFH
jgi:hypothetical protein